MNKIDILVLWKLYFSGRNKKKNLKKLYFKILILYFLGVILTELMKILDVYIIWYEREFYFIKFFGLVRDEIE